MWTASTDHRSPTSKKNEVGHHQGRRCVVRDPGLTVTSVGVRMSLDPGGRRIAAGPYPSSGIMEPIMNRLMHRARVFRACHGSALIILLLAGCGGPMENSRIRVIFDAGRPAEPIHVVDRQTSEAFALSSAAPQLAFREGRIGGPQVLPTRITRQFSLDENSIILEYPPQKAGPATVLVRRVITLPRRGSLLRQWIEFDAAPSGATRQITLERVALLDEPLPEPAEFSMPGWQSYPVFTRRLFFGVEFPVASAAVKDGRIILSHAPGTILQLPASYRSRDAVIGLCSPGRVRESFERYVDSFRRRGKGPHFNYNSWWTSPVPFSENDIQGLIKIFEEQLYGPFGVPMDSFTIDMGWSARHGIWKIDRSLFPNEFAPLNQSLSRQQCRLGLWWSPSNNYTPQSFDNIWAADQGYETQPIGNAVIKDYRLCCLAKGTRYQTEAKRAMTYLAGRFRLGQMKFDGYRNECAESGHGHLPGELSREITAEGIIDIFEAVRQASPDIWMEPTCFGYDASPWWLRYVESVIGPFGDDAPAGAVPAPIYRESYTTSRDFYNLHGTVTPVPIASQEVLGIIHQTPDPLYNDAVVAVLRGHQFISLYLNPKHMKPEEYRFLSELMTWSRANAPLLERTRVILPRTWREQGLPTVDQTDQMPRETYGYAHWHDGQGLICLRNPWIRMERVEITLDETTVGVDRPFKGYAAIQEYPYHRCLATGLRSGDPLGVSVGPYETKVIRLCRSDGPAGPEQPGERANTAKVDRAESRAVKTTTQPAQGEPFGDDYTQITPPEGLRWTTTIEGYTREGGWKVYYLLESEKSPDAIDPTFVINGSPAEPRLIDSAGQWSASGLGTKFGWKWYVVDLPAASWHISSMIDLPQEDISASAWLVRSFVPDAADNKRNRLAGDAPAFPLPPDYRAEVSVPVIAPARLLTADTGQIVLTAKTERIPGIYLDRLEPAAASQGWGELKKNKSVWDKPLCIGTQRFARGIGTHAPARLVYDLGGQYKAFHGFAGQDAAASGSIAFEIQVDGQKRWESGVMKRFETPKEFNVPVAGAKTLTIIVTDGGDHILGDHANLGNAWLEK